MNRRDLRRFVDVNQVLDNIEKEEGFSFFTDDVTEDLKYK